MPPDQGRTRGGRPPVRVLAVSDEVDEALLAGLRRPPAAELILACGDLPAGYLAYLMDALVAGLAPAVLLHGHTSPADVAATGRPLGGTVVRNVTGRYLIDVPPLPTRSSAAGTAARTAPASTAPVAGRRHAT